MDKKAMNTSDVKYIPTILDREACRKHGAPRGVPCWAIVLDAGKIVHAVCNNRVKRAGYNALPSIMPKRND